MTELITAAIGLATVVCSFIATEALLAYPKQLASLQTDLNNELAKGYDSDDAKIESLYSQIQVIIGAINNEVALFQTSKQGVTTATTTSSSSKSS